MNKLIEKLSEFQDSRRKGEDLESSFEKLAKYLLYGGYFHCSEWYDLYITSVEFYYHEEDGDIKDPIMYHRNKIKWINSSKKEQPESILKPFFVIGTLNPHMSGVDITFEDYKDLKYRASALIRAFVVKGKGVKKPIEDGRSTYVYDYLFDGLSVDKERNQLEWKEIQDFILPSENLPRAIRKNVYNYVSEDEARKLNIDVEKMKYKDAEYYKTDTLSNKKWRFSRLDSKFQNTI